MELLLGRPDTCQHFATLVTTTQESATREFRQAVWRWPWPSWIPHQINSSLGCGTFAPWILQYGSRSEWVWPHSVEGNAFKHQGWSATHTYFVWSEWQHWSSAVGSTMRDLSWIKLRFWVRVNFPFVFKPPLSHMPILEHWNLLLILSNPKRWRFPEISFRHCWCIKNLKASSPKNENDVFVY